MASLQNFFKNRQPLVLQEGYSANTTDLVTLKSEADDAWLDRQILGLLVKANNPLLSVSWIKLVVLNHLFGHN